MTVWQEAVLGLCLCMITTGLIRLLMPSGSWQRIGQTVISVLLVASVIHVYASCLGEMVFPAFSEAPFEPATVMSEKGKELLERNAVQQVKQISHQIAQQHRVTIDDVRIQVGWNREQVTVERIAVSAGGEASNITLFSKALSEAVGGEIVVESRNKT